MRCIKIAQNAVQPVFDKIKAYVTFTVEISSPIIWAISVICKKQSRVPRQSPNRRKFAQSGQSGEK
jgi:hypothetical protein